MKSCYTSQKKKRTKKRASGLGTLPFGFLSISLLLLCHTAPVAEGFFFSSSLFRRFSSNPTEQPQTQAHISQDVGSARDQVVAEQKTSARVVNRPKVNDNSDNNNNNAAATTASQPPNFHVPKSLCLACQNFPWMPVAGVKTSARQPLVTAASQTQGVSGTFIVNPIGRGQILTHNRKPFAIKFDPSSSQNIHNQQHKPTATKDVQNAKAPEPQKGHESQEKQPTILKPAASSNEPQKHIDPNQQPAQFFQPPPNPPLQQNSYNHLQTNHPERRPERPTILRPIEPPRPAQQNAQQSVQVQNYRPISNQGGNMKIPPMAIGTIVAVHKNPSGVNHIQPANLVYQEYSQTHGPSIAPILNQAPKQVASSQIHYGKPITPPSKRPQNFKLPIIPRPMGGVFKINPVQGRPFPQPFRGQMYQISNVMLPPQPFGNQLQNAVVKEPQKAQVFYPPPQATMQFGPATNQLPQKYAGMSIAQHMQPPPPPGDQNSQHPIVPYLFQLANGQGTSGAQAQATSNANIKQQIQVHQGVVGQSFNIVPVPVPKPTAFNQQKSVNTETKGTQPTPTKKPASSTVENDENNVDKTELTKPETSETGKKSNEHQSLKDSVTAAGWEIIPSVQTDLTHLFNPSPHNAQNAPSSNVIIQKQNIEGSQTDFRAHLTSNNPLKIPVPVPIPVPNAQNVKNPLFLVAQNKPLIEPSSNNVRVQDVTYHEEGRDQSQKPANSPSVPISIPVVRQPPPAPIVFQPHFDPLPPSILTALKHAQRTSYLTHQYHNNGEKRQQETVYVNSVPVEESFGTPFRSPSQESSSGSNNVETFEKTNSENDLTESESSDKTNVDSNEVVTNDDDQELVNCENEQHWVLPEGKEAEKTAENNKKPLLVYYPTPAQKPKAPPVYWLQSTRFGPGGVRYITRPVKINRNKPLEEPSSGSNQKVVFSRPVSGWENNNNKNNHDQDSSLKDDIELQSIEETEESSEAGTFGGISPGTTFGDKIVVKHTTPLPPAPFDVLSLNEDQDQSKEHYKYNVESSADTESRNEQLYKPEPLGKPPGKGFQFFTITHPPALSGFKENKPVPKPVAPTSATVTTTSSSTGNQNPATEKGVAFSLQTFRFPSFTSEQVIFPHFSNARGNVEPQGSSSQTQQSWRAFFRTNKSPKIVELGSPDNSNYLTPSVGNDKLTGTSSEKIIFSRPLNKDQSEVTTAECITTAEATVLQGTVPTSEETKVVSTTAFTPSRLVEVVPSTPTRLRTGTRFPEGRPTIASLYSSIEDDEADSSASIAVPVYQLAGSGRETKKISGSPIHNEPVVSYSPPPNLLTIGDIYKDSEIKMASKTSQSKTMSSLSSTVTMVTSTEKSSSYSVSSSSSGGDDKKQNSNPVKSNTLEKGTEKNKNSNPTTTTTATEQDVDSVTPSTSTKIVKTVRVRHRMKSGSPRTASGNIVSSSLIRNKFRGPGRIRVVQRPVQDDDYMKNFPEFATPEGDSELNEEEAEQVKKALIELKRAVV